MKTKKIIAAVAAFVMVCGAVPSQPFASIVKNSAVTANAETPAIYFEFDAETGTITKYYGTDAEVVIPSEIGGVAVTSIGDYAFSWCSSLESITIPDSVTSIEGWAFCNCSSLQSIKIPDSVTTIKDYAFYGCDKLTISGYAGTAAETYANENEFEFIALDDEPISNIVEEGKCGENVTYTLDADGVLTISGNGDMYDYEDSAFSQTPFRGSEIKKIIIEDGITSIGNNVFHSYLDEVTEISIPDSVTRIGVGSMSGLRITKLVIPEGVTTIGAGAFYCLYSLEDITIPSSVTSIGGDAFFGTKWMESKWSENPLVVVNGILISSNIVNEESITIPDNVTTIGEGLFMGHTEMKNVTIPDSVKTIEKTAFYGCQNLTSVKIPDGVSSIGERAFFGCNSMDSIEIPASVTSIEKNALGFKITNEGTVKLENFTISGYKGTAAEKYANENGFEFISLGDAPAPEFILGDADGDGAITAMDASAALTYYVTQPENIEELGFPFSFKAADWDGNGIINAIDASAILTYYVENN